MASKTVKPPVPESKTPMGKLFVAEVVFCAFKLNASVIKTVKENILNFINTYYLANVIIFLDLNIKLGLKITFIHVYSHLYIKRCNNEIKQFKYSIFNQEYTLSNSFCN